MSYPQSHEYDAKPPQQSHDAHAVISAPSGNNRNPRTLGATLRHQQPITDKEREDIIAAQRVEHASIYA